MPGRHLSDRQVRHYMKLRTKHRPSVAAAKAGISTATAYRLESDPQLPSQRPTVRSRRRPDPLAGIFDEEVVPLLQQTPDLRAVTIFEELLRRHPEHRRRTRGLAAAAGAARAGLRDRTGAGHLARRVHACARSSTRCRRG